MTDELRRLAEAATPGPWRSEENSDCWQLFADRVVGGEPVHGFQLIKAPKHGTPYAEYWPDRADAAYIAAASPDRILALLDVVEAARALERVLGRRSDLERPVLAVLGVMDALAALGEDVR